MRGRRRRPEKPYVAAPFDHTRTARALPSGSQSWPVTASSIGYELPAPASSSGWKPPVPVQPVPASHAGGRGFESRRSRSVKCLQIGICCCLYRRHEQLERYRWAGLDLLLDVGVLHHSSRWLVEHVDREDEAGGGREEALRNDLGEAVVPVDQEAGRERRELASDRELERDEAVVRDRARVMLRQHRPQRLALIHGDHGEGAVFPGEGVEGRHEISSHRTSSIPSCSIRSCRRGSVSVRSSCSRSSV